MDFRKAALGAALFIGLGLASCEPAGATSSEAEESTSTSQATSEKGDSSSSAHSSEEATSSKEESTSIESSSTPASSDQDSSEESLPSSEEGTSDPDTIENYTRTFEVLGPDGAALPSYASLRLIAGPLFEDKLDDSNLMTAVDAAKGLYSFNFGTVAIDEEIEYKIVATTAASTSVWTYEGIYSGDMLKENGTSKNPYIVCATSSDATVTGWSFANWPVDPSSPRYDFKVSLTLDDYSEEVHGGIYLYTSNNWSSGILMDSEDGRLFEATVSGLLPETYQYYFRTVNMVGESYVYLQPAPAQNYEVTIVDANVEIAYSGSIAQPNGLTVATPAETIEHYTRKFEIDNVAEGVDIRIAGDFNSWDTSLEGTSNLLAEVEDGVYSFDFGTQEVGHVIKFKLVATSTESLSFWDFELGYEGDTWKDEDGSINPYFVVESENDPAIADFAFLNAPAKFHVTVTIDDIILNAGDTLWIHGSFIRDAWSSTLLTLKDGHTYEGDVATRLGEFEFGFKVQNEAGAQTNWIASGPNVNLKLSVVESGQEFVLTGTTAGLSFAA